MTTELTYAPTSRATLIGGWTLRGLVIAFMTFDSVIKLIKIDPVVESFQRLGYDPAVSHGIGLLELAIVGLYAFPRTQFLGAVLLTGLLGGAVASHTRMGDPLFSHILFGVYVGVLAWGGLYLHSPRLRALMPVAR